MKIEFLKIVKNFIKVTAIYTLFSFPLHASSIIDDSQNAFEVTPLMSAAIDQDITGVKFFTRSDNATINQQNIGGATALHLASRVGNLEIVKILVKNGANLDIKDNEGWTPLMRAVVAGNIQVVSYLLDKNANAAIVNYSSESVIYHAASVSCHDCLKLLLEKYDFVANMGLKLLKTQINASYEVARNKEDMAVQNMLTEYLNLITSNDSKQDENDKKFHFSKKDKDVDASTIELYEIDNLPSLGVNNSDSKKFVIVKEGSNDSQNTTISDKKVEEMSNKKFFKFKQIKEEEKPQEKKEENKKNLTKNAALKYSLKPLSLIKKYHKPKKFVVLKGEDKKIDIRVNDKIEKVIILDENNDVVEEVDTKNIQNDIEVKKKEILFKFNKVENNSGIVEIEETQSNSSKKLYRLEKSDEKTKNEVIKKHFENDEALLNQEQYQENQEEGDILDVNKKRYYFIPNR
ncbi:MAG: ankyrin repeat domain-containing protein [Rickettsiales bacterium]|nr:ankyrin repeat domain-containing protein [Rickettsiales bacterium]